MADPSDWRAAGRRGGRALPTAPTEVHVRIDFNASEGASLGVEWELQLVDPTTRDLVPAGGEILAAMGKGHPDGEHPKAKHELFECTVEIITGVCATAAEARADLAGTLGELQAEASTRGIEVACSGTHPFASWSEQPLSPNPRYHRLIEEMQWVARRLVIFGVHVHVGVRSPERVIRIANALAGYIPHILALSASSPYFGGHDTGLASSRSKVFESLPTAGLPYQLSGWEEFEQFMETLVESKSINTIRDVWWDIRPHPDFGTVELRICDGLPTLDEVTTHAALGQSLVAWLDARIDAGEPLPKQRQWTVKENKWRAARHGLEAELIVEEPGTTAPARTAIRQLLDELMPTARALGCEAELLGANEILERGPSYQRQREVLAAGGSLVDVVDSLVGEMNSGTPAPAPAPSLEVQQ